ncbi:hypothetical protein ACFPPG_30225 [Bradyrhizobium oligotrophicum]
MDLVIERLQRFERANGHDTALRQFMTFAVEFLNSMIMALPPTVPPLFSIACGDRTTLVNSAELDDARSRCWQAIDALDDPRDFQDKTNCAYRAVLCCLMREPPRLDLSETSYWFLSFCEVIEDHSDLLPDLTAKHFPTCGGESAR